MFKISQSDSYFWPVIVNLPGDHGSRKKETFDAQFKRISASRIREIRDQGERAELNDVDLCKEILLGWRDVKSEKNEEIPYSVEARDQMLDIQLVASSIIQAFFESLTGAKVKN